MGNCANFSTPSRWRSHCNHTSLFEGERAPSPSPDIRTTVHIRTAPTGATMDTSLAAYNLLPPQGSAPGNATKETQNEDFATDECTVASTIRWRVQQLPGRA